MKLFSERKSYRVSKACKRSDVKVSSELANDFVQQSDAANIDDTSTLGFLKSKLVAFFSERKFYRVSQTPRRSDLTVSSEVANDFVRQSDAENIDDSSTFGFLKSKFVALFGERKSCRVSQTHKRSNSTVSSEVANNFVRQSDAVIIDDSSALSSPKSTRKHSGSTVCSELANDFVQQRDTANIDDSSTLGPLKSTIPMNDFKSGMNIFVKDSKNLKIGDHNTYIYNNYFSKVKYNLEINVQAKIDKVYFYIRR
ncbi:CLUMA_CG004172, isoform A [Clunio marinus]|uniref:CLUMA_CG004172, isoform A n=1 Tax=Clunio marinus TaxID=568069 RepID=A0A1J1HVG7_9DIPT|nr:CLUMA_CG004172, isoform A [Clunio marinus]